jgi:hypothetical protein
LRKFITLVAVLGLAASVLSGCAVNRATATVDPSADLRSKKTMHVVKLEEDGYDVNELITEKLRSMGYTVTTSKDKPAEVDAIVTYWDKWVWDITMYLLELTVTIRDPKNDFPLATGNSFHTSLTRKSPTEMVDEVVNNIFKEEK